MELYLINMEVQTDLTKTSDISNEQVNHRNNKPAIRFFVVIISE